MIRISFACVLILSAKTAAADDVRSIPLILHPTASPSPALKYAFLPELRDSNPWQRRHALPAGRRAHEAETRAASATGTRRWKNGWRSRSTTSPRRKAGQVPQAVRPRPSRKWRPAYKRGLQLGHYRATRHEGLQPRCCPMFPKCGSIASLLVLRIRYELADGRPDRAAHSLQIGFALSRHVGDGSTLIEALVGIAIGGLLGGRGWKEFVQQPTLPTSPGR